MAFAPKWFRYCSRERAQFQCCARGIRHFSSWRLEWAKVKHGVNLLKDEAKVSVSNLQNGDLSNGLGAQQVKRTALDMARVLPFLGVVALPGGMVFALIMAKVMPWALPSTFGVMQTTTNDLTHDTEWDQMMRRLVYQALEDLYVRAKARPGKDDELLHQLKEILSDRVTEQPRFDCLYALSEHAVLRLLDDETITKLVERFGLKMKDIESRDRKELERQLRAHISRIRAEDLILVGHISELDAKHLEVHLKDRGLANVTSEDRRYVLEAWLNMTVRRALPVSLLGLACIVL